MMAVNAEPDADVFARGVARLLKEYAHKLELRLTEVRSVKLQSKAQKVPFMATSEWQSLQQRVNSLSHSLLTATREASQLAEQGAVQDLTRFELRLRLAEVEGLIHAIEAMLHSID